VFFRRSFWTLECPFAPKRQKGGVFIPDADVGDTTTDPFEYDSDDDTWLGGEKNTNLDGEIDARETDPKDSNSYPGASIATLSEWGMIIFMLLLITAGMIVIRRKQEQ
jgi:hypothetical protein